MAFSLEKIKETNNGVLYKLLLDNNKVYLKYKNVKALFKPDKYRNTYYIKWNVGEICLLEELEYIENIINSCFDGRVMSSNILKKNKYPLMLNTKYTYKKTKPIIISNTFLSVPEFIETNLDKSYNITLEIGKIFITENEIKYPLDIKYINLVR
tara:strand:+ start:835 stop:1296 length:462 start_codon:yes stop_codon:yes gene_type:complete